MGRRGSTTRTTATTSWSSPPHPGGQECVQEAEYVQRWHYSPDYGHDARRGCGNRLDGFTPRGMSKVPANPIEETQIIKDYKAKYKDYHPLMDDAGHADRTATATIKLKRSVLHVYWTPAGPTNGTIPQPQGHSQNDIGYRLQTQPILSRVRRICAAPAPHAEGQGERPLPKAAFQLNTLTQKAARKVKGRRLRGRRKLHRRPVQRHHTTPLRDAVNASLREVWPFFSHTRTATGRVLD